MKGGFREPVSRRAAWVLLCALAVGVDLAGCRIEERQKPASKAKSDPSPALNRIAESYVRLVLAVGEHDPNYVDAYYGPEKWREDVKAEKKSLESIREAATPLLRELEGLDVTGQEEIVELRQQYLFRQLEALVARVGILGGRKLTFDRESKLLYDAVAPTYPENHYKEILDRLERLLPGKGPLVDRYERFRKEFIIPKAKLDQVFSAAIEEGRKRTRQHIDLPAEESFTVEYVTGKPWSGYNWYKGNSRSVIQVNTDLPIHIDRAVDLACHEGYPGHHVYNALLEKRLVKERGWVEFTVYPLFSPQSLIAEGSANFGIEVAFPGEERIAFEREILFPLAGIRPERAASYYQVRKLVEELDYAGNEAARRYLDGAINRDQAAEWLTTFTVIPMDRARQRVRFIDQYRSYVINYNLGQDLVKHYIEARGGTADHPEKRWEEFAKLLSSPRLPSGLK